MPPIASPPPDQAIVTIGVLSDTHGHYPESLDTVFQGVDHILHAGDIDRPEVVARLRRLAPVTCVRGNMDRGPWAAHLPSLEIVEIGGRRIGLLHDLARLDLTPEAAGLAAVVAGHSHRPEVAIRNGILFLNPGSAAYPRGGSATVALLRLQGGLLQPRIVSLPG